MTRAVGVSWDGKPVHSISEQHKKTSPNPLRRSSTPDPPNHGGRNWAEPSRTLAAALREKQGFPGLVIVMILKCTALYRAINIKIIKILWVIEQGVL